MNRRAPSLLIPLLAIGCPRPSTESEVVQPDVAASVDPVRRFVLGWGMAALTEKGVLDYCGPAKVECWGIFLVADSDETPDPTLEKPLVLDLPGPAIEFGVGDTYGCARLDDGRVFCFGAEEYGQRARLAPEFATRPEVIQ